LGVETTVDLESEGGSKDFTKKIEDSWYLSAERQAWGRSQFVFRSSGNQEKANDWQKSKI
jgi:hypothetical protein